MKCFVKRALNAAGYAFIDVSVSGTNVGNFMAGYGKAGLRAALIGYGSAVITDHLHNDRKSGIGLRGDRRLDRGEPGGWNNTGLRVRYGWHNAWLRSKLKPGARIVRCTLAPATNSTDAWATVAGPDRQERRRGLGGGLCDGSERRPVQAQRPDHAARRASRASPTAGRRSATPATTSMPRSAAPPTAGGRRRGPATAPTRARRCRSRRPPTSRPRLPALLGF